MDHNYWIPPNPNPNTTSSNVRSETDSSILSGDMNKANLSPSTSKESQEIVLFDGALVNIQIHNILCNYTLPMHIDLRMVAYHSVNVDYDRVHGVLIKQLRSPPSLVKIYNSGKIVIVKCKSEEDCKRAARSIGRMVQRSMNKLDQKICIRNYRVSNILATCRMPFGVRIEDLARKYRGEGVKYEPELMIGLEWTFSEPKANLRIHTTGTVTITGATSETDLVKCIEKVYPFLKEFSCQREMNHKNSMEHGSIPHNKLRRRQRPKNNPLNGYQTAKKARRGQIDETGIYENQIYFSDEDEDAMDNEDFGEQIGSDEDELT